MSPGALILLLWLALGVGLLADEVRVRVLAHRRRARQAEFHRHLDEAIEVAMGRHPSARGPEDDDEVMARIAEQARRTGGAR